MKINRHNYESWFLDYAEGNLKPEEVAEVLLFLESNEDLKEEFELFDGNATLPKEDFNFSGEDLKHILDKKYSQEELLIAFNESDLSEKKRNEVIDKLSSDQNFKNLYDQLSTLKLEPISNAEEPLEKLHLKRIDDSNYLEFFAAYHEGDLSRAKREELNLFVQDKKALKTELEAFGRVKMIPDTTLVFTRKVKLKKKKGLLISFYSWASVAAAIAIIFIFVFQNRSVQDIIEDQTATIHPFQEDVSLAENDVVEQEKGTENRIDKEQDIEPLIITTLEDQKPQNAKKKTPKLKERIPVKKEVNFAFENTTVVPKEEKTEEADVYVIQEIVKEVEQKLPEDDIAENSELHEEVDGELIAAAVVNTNNNAFHILDLVEKADDRTGLFEFESNHKEKGEYRETSFSIGKFSVKRKTKRKVRS